MAIDVSATAVVGRRDGGDRPAGHCGDGGSEVAASLELVPTEPVEHEQNDLFGAGGKIGQPRSAHPLKDVGHDVADAGALIVRRDGGGAEHALREERVVVDGRGGGGRRRFGPRRFRTLRHELLPPGVT